MTSLPNTGTLRIVDGLINRPRRPTKCLKKIQKPPMSEYAKVLQGLQSTDNNVLISFAVWSREIKIVILSYLTHSFSLLRDLNINKRLWVVRIRTVGFSYDKTGQIMNFIIRLYLPILEKEEFVLGQRCGTQRENQNWTSVGGGFSGKKCRSFPTIHLVKGALVFRDVRFERCDAPRRSLTLVRDSGCSGHTLTF